MTDLMKRLREWWHMPTTYCQKCGSPVPDCYALCFVCLSDERGRRIEELKAKLKDRHKRMNELQKSNAELLDEVQNMDFVKELQRKYDALVDVLKQIARHYGSAEQCREFAQAALENDDE